MAWVVLTFSIVEWVIRLAMIPVILRRRMSPAPALAWLLVIFALPVVGLVMYWLIGVQYLGIKRVQSHRRVIEDSSASRRADAVAAHTQRPAFEGPQRNLIRQAEQVTGNPIVGDSSVDLLGAPAVFLDRLIDDIHAAEHHVHLLYYIFWDDASGRRVIDALIAAAQRGVPCRVLVDAAGSRQLLKGRAPREMIGHGVAFHAMLPVTPWRRRLARIDLRNHRKLAVIDGRTAYAGSHNLVNPDYNRADYEGDWIDLSGRFTGPVVAQFQAVFLDDWTFTTHERLESDDLFPLLDPTGAMTMQVVPTGPNHEADSFRRVVLTALNAAEERIIMTTPYLVPDEPTILALMMAADRGVAVDILTPAKGDHPLVNAAAASNYETLMDAGVTIHRFHGGLLHAKTATVDDAFAFLGSANLDIRSFDLNFEINTLMYGRQITERLRHVQLDFLAMSDPLDAERWRRRPALRRYVENAAALLSPLL